MEQYEDFLKRIEDAYEKESGSRPEDVSDAGLRLRVMAGELYRLRAEVDWLSRQAFPHTASGEWLDRHGAQRGVLRKAGAYATGTLSFSRYLPLSFDLVIPKGTVCATSGEEPVEFVTLEEGVLETGSLRVNVPAQAVVKGPAGNAAAGHVNTLVTAVTGVNYVSNTTAFTGGAAPEDDEEYRVRVLSAYADMPNGTNAAYYRDVAMNWPGITAAGVKPRINGANTVGVYVWGEGEAPSDDTISALSAEFQKRREMGVTVTVQAAANRVYNIGVRIKLRSGADPDRAKEDIEAALRLYFSGLTIGSPVYLTDLERVAMNAAPVTYLSLSNNLSDYTGQVSVIPVAGTISVTEVVS